MKKEIEMKFEAHRIPITDEDAPYISIHPASEESVLKVLSASTEGCNGRSNFVWVRLPDGDLLLGVFPQGETYESVETDASYIEK